MASSLNAGIDVFDDIAEPCRELAKGDAALAFALGVVGEPHIRRRPGGFGGLFRIIVEQQVSVPSAQAILSRVEKAMDSSNPDDALRLGVSGLRALGISTPKAGYITGIADKIRSGAFEFRCLETLADHDALALLTELKGVGPWTASIYLLFCEGRVDIWPPRDVALKAAYARAIADLGIIGSGPSQEDLDDGSQIWSPYRGIAAHILWTYYASTKGRKTI
ncbi:MAG: DNA-3-methyladenine glycosylase 2 family protein [Pseudomonadota bacterium]